MRYQSGSLRNPKEDDPTFDTYSDAFLHVSKESTFEPQGIWSSQEEGSELLFIVWEREVYRK